MKWVTRDHVHMDRVASPWLILRFIDRDAEFSFVPLAKTLGKTLDPSIELPSDAIPFALPGAEIGPHDAEGSTFRKLMVKYKIDDFALEIMAQIIESGVVHVFHHHEPGYSVGKLKYPEGVGLDALALGMMYGCANDAANIDASIMIYDALYDYCSGKSIELERPDIAALPVPARWDAIKTELDNRRRWQPGKR